MARKKITYNDLIKLAKSYGVDDNPLFISAAERYMIQQEIIVDIGNSIKSDTNLLTTKEYVKGRENLYVNPLVKELPKMQDSCNKTLGTMLDIIAKLGAKEPDADDLEAFLSE